MTSFSIKLKNHKKCIKSNIPPQFVKNLQFCFYSSQTAHSKEGFQELYNEWQSPERQNSALHMMLLPIDSAQAQTFPV